MTGKTKMKNLCVCLGVPERCEFHTFGLESANDLSYAVGRKYPGIGAKRTSPVSQDSGVHSWTWEMAEFVVKRRKPVFYYVLVYENDRRVRKHETLATQCDHTIIDERELEVIVLGLYGKREDHNFIQLVPVTGMWQYNLAVDKLSQEYNGIYTGFLSSCGFAKSLIVHVKKFETVEAQDRINRKECIELARKAGGQHNLKYLACSDPKDQVMWIVMELCCKKTLKDLISERQQDMSFKIDFNKLKNCLRHILQGLHHLHCLKIEHGGIFLDNILPSLPNGDHLKIGHCYSLEKLESQDTVSKMDTFFAARLFYKCLIRDDTSDPEVIERPLSPGIRESWSSCLKPLTGIQNEFDATQKAQIEKIMKVVYYRKLSSDVIEAAASSNEMNPVWIELLRKLAKLFGKENSTPADEKDRYLSAYFIMHIALDRPTAKDILHHPFFWNEYKILDFITHMEGWFYEGQKGNSADEQEQNAGGQNSDTIKSIFCKACAHTWRSLHWISDITTATDESCDEAVRDNMIANVIGYKIYSRDDLIQLVEFLKEHAGGSEIIKYETVKRLVIQFWNIEADHQLAEPANRHIMQFEPFLESTSGKIVQSLSRHFVDAQANFEQIKVNKKKLYEHITKSNLLNRFRSNMKLDATAIARYVSFLKETLAVAQDPNCLNTANVKKFLSKLIADRNKVKGADMTRFMRLVRNTYAHYQQPFTVPSLQGEPVKKSCSFNSASSVWKFFGNMYPEMICLLHRTVWLKRNDDPENLPDDLKPFFEEQNNADSLELLID